MKSQLIKIGSLFCFGFCRKVVRKYSSFMIIFVTIFIGQAMFPNYAISGRVYVSKSISENNSISQYNIKRLKCIEDSKHELQYPPKYAMAKYRTLCVEGEYHFFYMTLLQELIDFSDPDILKAKYEDDVDNMNIETIHSLIKFLDILKKNNRMQQPSQLFEKQIDSIFQRSEQMAQQAIESKDLRQMLIAYYFLLYIEPYKDAKVQMEKVVSNIKKLQASIIQEKEIALINNELKDAIKKGETRNDLEQRISRLPEKDRILIEEMRKKLLEEKSIEDIKWKKEELDKETAKPKEPGINKELKDRIN